MCEMNPLDDVRDAILAPSSRGRAQLHLGMIPGLCHLALPKPEMMRNSKTEAMQPMIERMFSNWKS